MIYHRTLLILLAVPVSKILTTISRALANVSLLGQKTTCLRHTLTRSSALAMENFRCVDLRVVVESMF